MHFYQRQQCRANSARTFDTDFKSLDQTRITALLPQFFICDNSREQQYFDLRVPGTSGAEIPSHRGASIYDVHTEGGGGVSPKEDVVREVA